MDTKSKLVKVTFDEIYKNGYSATSIDRILKKASMNKGSMYHFFKSKKELTLEVIEIHINNYIENKYASLLILENNIIDGLLTLIKTKDKFNYTYGCRLNNLVQELSSKDEDFKIALEKVYFHFEEIIETVLQNAVKNKEISHPNIKELAIFVVASIEGCLATAKKSNSADIYLSCISQLDFYLNSLKIKQ